MLEVHALNPWTAGPFRGLATGQGRVALESAHPDGSVVAFGATVGEEAAGLVVASLHSQAARAGTFAVETVSVRREFRGRGIGSALLRRLESHLRQRGAPLLLWCYEADAAGTPPRQRWLARHGWSPDTRRLLYVACAATVVQEPWVVRAHVPRPFEVFSWGELDPEGRRQMEERLRGAPWIPDAVAPWHLVDLEPANSLGVSRDGETVGWILTQRTSAQTVRYAALCVRPDVRCRGLGVLLLAEAMRRQVQALGIGSSGAFSVRRENAPVLRLIDRRLKRHVTASLEMAVATKALTGTPAEGQRRTESSRVHSNVTRT